jgi:ferredoxin
MRRINRREFLKIAGLCVIATIFENGSAFARRRRIQFGAAKGGLIRPPGALEEEDFCRMCIRCGECIKVCPAKCLFPAGVGSGISSWETPVIVPRKAGCIRCGNCASVCPTGAIEKVPMEIARMGTATIDRQTCLVWTGQKECLVCLEYCPVQAIFKDSKWRPVVDTDRCVGCGVCEQNCPVPGPVAAITVSSHREKRYNLKENAYR